MKRFPYLTLFIALVLTGCASDVSDRPIPEVMPPNTVSTIAAPATAPQARTLNVFASSALADPLVEIGYNFEVINPGVAVAFNFADSKSLQVQIESGAPADLFVSANKSEMDSLTFHNLIGQGASQVFVTNSLIVILPANNPAGLEKLADLTKPGIKLVLAAEDEPVGGDTRQALDLMNGKFGSDFKDKVLANVISNEGNVDQVVSKVQLGEADAGIVYTSAVAAAPELKTIEIPADSNVIARYAIVQLGKSANADLAAAFINFVFSPDGQTVFKKWGFAPAR